MMPDKKKNTTKKHTKENPLLIKLIKKAVMQYYSTMSEYIMVCVGNYAHSNPYFLKNYEFFFFFFECFV